MKPKIQDAASPEKIELFNNNEPLILKTANDWINHAKKLPIPKQIFNGLWGEGELCILFSRTGLGKSALAVQIADTITAGGGRFPFDCEIDPQPVVYCDFELTPKQFELRHSNKGEDHHRFNDNFFRIGVNTDYIQEGKTEDRIFNYIEQTINQTGSRILIVDNITWLSTDTEKARDAQLLMKMIKQLKSKHDLSVLVIAHTPKRFAHQPISIIDIQGSAAIGQFIDSCFAIGDSSRGGGLRYIKQLKARTVEEQYREDNVIVCKLNKEHNFLKFEFVEFGLELDHLRRQDNIDELRKQAHGLYKDGKSLRECAEAMGVSHMKVQRLLKVNEAPF